MEQYLIYHQNENRPRIIGLIASRGIEQRITKWRKNALTKLYELCATLNCFDIATVTNEEHIEENLCLCFYLGLVLVSRTFYAKFLFDYFKEYDDIVKPCWLVGQSVVDYQNSLSEQDKTLRDFRKGLNFSI